MNRKLIQTVLALLIVSFLLTAPRAQQTSAPPAAENRVTLYQALLDLTNPWTVMCIAAHPDDEDGTSLIVMRRKYGAHTVSLFSTFGEGGQNAIGPELYEEMGAIRARETRAAAEIQGSEPHFLGLKDFGFSKSADEAFRFWGHEEALRRMVLEIRKLRPDVIITNHSVTSNDHGHHQATARLELEAFDAAADSKQFPEQLKDGVTVWQVQRLFVRARGTQNQTDNASIVTIDPNENDPVRGTSFAEQALSALQKHATQGPWPRTVSELAMRFRGSPDGKLPVTRYVLTRDAKSAQALAKDSHNFLDGLRLPDETAKAISPPTIEERPLTDFVDQREQVFDALLAGTERQAREISDGPGEPRLRGMRERLRISLWIASGVSARLTAVDDVLVRGELASFELTLTNNGRKPLRLRAARLSSDKERIVLSPPQTLDSALVPGGVLKIPLTYKVPADEPFTVPHSQYLYEEGFAGKTVTAAVLVEVNAVGFAITPRVLLDVAPTVEITSVKPSVLPLTGSATQQSPHFELTVRSQLHRAFRGLIKVIGTHASSEGPLLAIMSETLALGPLEVRQVSLSPTKALNAFAALEIEVASSNGTKIISSTNVPLMTANARVAPNLRIGYVRGFDFSLPNALNALGVESKELSVDEVKTADLQKYTSIIVDNRVYESTPGLIATNQKLLDYANAGGTLIVFYHKSNEWNPDERRKRPQLAPYKLILGDERITDETASITFLEPQHPLLNSPNKIGQEDFAGWIQERGLYYPKEWDPQYQALLQSNDPGEAPLKGGLLVADYGRGKYIYTSMVWYRELRAGVPGAYRVLANMISYGRAK